MTNQLLTKISSLFATKNGKLNATLTFLSLVLLTSFVVTGAVAGVRQLGIIYA